MEAKYFCFKAKKGGFCIVLLVSKPKFHMHNETIRCNKKLNKIIRSKKMLLAALNKIWD
jgi:hypothetical protein